MANLHTRHCSPPVTKSATSSSASSPGTVLMLERTCSSGSARGTSTLSSNAHLTSGWSQHGKKDLASVAANIVAMPSFSRPFPSIYLFT